MDNAAKDPAIRNISDTARWVAFYRAMETERSDAIFHDPYARKLAGERGEQIVNALRGGKRQSWVMIVRTKVLDEILLRILTSEPIDVVTNLAAGLDARPYRLALPAALRWVDVDLPAMIVTRRKCSPTKRRIASWNLSPWTLRMFPRAANCLPVSMPVRAALL